MKVLAELGERMLGRLAFEIPQLVHATPLHRGLGPRAPDGPPQSRVNAPCARSQRTRNGVVMTSRLPPEPPERHSRQSHIGNIVM